ncbi:MAG: diaminopimelate epimerase [Bacteroidetes bacterium]|nr:MAG: diaminopimelate epimerase [Bacteroidota bacterium]
MKERTIQFDKYHGAGNDFILINSQALRFSLSEEEIALLCHRRFGIGADGLIMVSKSNRADFEMRYYNADGRISSMCGNGGRCVAAFAFEKGLAGKEQLFEGPDGLHRAKITQQQGTQNHYHVMLHLRNINTIHQGHGYATLNTGSPHYVTFTHNLESMDVKSQGRKIRLSSQFAPQGINVNFVEEKSGKLFVRTYERGVENETLACGTGVTAAAIAWAEQRGVTEGNIPILTKGGNMQVSFRKEDSSYTDIILSGPAEKVFEGVITLKNPKI